MTDRGRTRFTSGFTMMETLMVVAITVILMGVAFVGVINYRRSSLRLELDATAKEIYIAAQNHLLTVFDEGSLEAYSAGSPKLGEEDTSNFDEKDGVYYFVYGTDANAVNSPAGDGKNSALGLMLPFGSIDETVRLGGSYIIQYQPGTGRVAGVFYAKPQGVGGLFGSFGAHSFEMDEYLNVAQLGGESQAESRLDYHGAVIGWYGGDTLEESTALKRPKLKVMNGDTLVAKVTNPNYEDKDYKLLLLVEGVSSGSQKSFELVGGSRLDSNVTDVEGNSHEFEIVLDDVTDKNGHFNQLFPGFVPGEDITVQVVAHRTNGIAKVAWSAEVTTNSLYESVEASDEVKRAQISSFRHFENLDAEISGIGGDADRLEANGTGNLDAVALTGADQRTDLSWPKFMEETGGGDSIRIYTTDGLDWSETDALYPVNTPETDRFEYNGHEHRVKDVVVLENEMPTGLFCAIKGATIRDLDLVNFDVHCDNDYAGALAGHMDGCTVEGVLAYNTVSEDDDDSGLSICGGKSTGGLVGMATDCEFRYCGAAEYVVSESGNAGGLVGEALGETTKTIISLSYSGGHTSEGEYLTDKDEKSGRYNVQAQSGKAGGLVGKADGTFEIDSCYSTCSVLGATAGGLIGSSKRGSVSASYATGLVGLVDDASTGGLFIGNLLGTELGKDDKINSYLSIANEDLPAVGSDTDEQLTLRDGVADITTYVAFAPNTADARPYDEALSSTFLYQTLGQLAGENDEESTSEESIPNRLKVHHGDWQDYATLVINKKA